MSDQNYWEYSFTWLIADIIPCNHKTEEELMSPTFSVGALNNSKWHLSIYPGGRNRTSKEYISVYLAKNKDNVSVEKIDIFCRIELILGKKIIKFALIPKSTPEDGTGIGFPKFYERDQLLDEMKKSNTNTLTLRCYISSCNEIKRPIEKSETRLLMLKDKSLFIWKMKFIDKIFSENRRYFCLNDAIYKTTIAMTQNHVTLIVQKMCDSSSISYQITGKISLLDTKGNESLSMQACHRFSAENQSEKWEFKDFIPKKLMLDNVNEGTTTLLCEFFIYNPMQSKIVSNTNGVALSNIESLSKLSLDFENMFFKKSNPDVKLRVDNRIEFKAHRCVLAARSPVFSSMFDQDMLENRSGNIDIADLDGDILDLFLKFLYTGVVDYMDSDTAAKLLQVADKYEVLSLKQMCAVFLMSALSVDNACKILRLADMVCDESLKACVLEFTAEHATEVFSSPELKKWAVANPILSAEMMTYLGKNFKFIPNISQNK